MRFIRESVKWSQSDFAKEIGISLPRQRAIEYKYTPLHFFVGSRICEKFKISARWLATGDGRIDEAMIVPGRGFFGGPEKTLFSSVYDRIFAEFYKAFDEKIMAPIAPERHALIRYEGSAAGRLEAEEALISCVRFWITSVPDTDFEGFINEVMKHGNLLLEKYKPDTPLQVDTRRKKLAVMRVAVEARHRLK